MAIARVFPVLLGVLGVVTLAVAFVVVAAALLLWLILAVIALVGRSSDELGILTAVVSGFAAAAVVLVVMTPRPPDDVAVVPWRAWVSAMLLTSAAIGIAAAAGLWAAIGTLLAVDVNVDPSRPEPIVLGATGVALILVAVAVRLGSYLITWLRTSVVRRPPPAYVLRSVALVIIAVALSAWLVVAGRDWIDTELDGWWRLPLALATAVALFLAILLAASLVARSARTVRRHGVGRALVDLVAIGVFLAAIIAAGFVLVEALGLADSPSAERRASLERAMIFVGGFALLGAILLATRRTVPPGPTEVTAFDVQEAAKLAREAADHARASASLAENEAGVNGARPEKVAAAATDAAACARIAARAGGDAAATLMRETSDVSFAALVQSLDDRARAAWRKYIDARAAVVAVSTTSGERKLENAATQAAQAAEAAESVAVELESVADIVTAVAEVAPPPVLPIESNGASRAEGGPVG